MPEPEIAPVPCEACEDAERGIQTSHPHTCTAWKVALLDAVFSIGPHEMFPSSRPGQDRP